MMIFIRRVAGDSMLPSYRPRQIAVFVRGRKFAPGDVVLINHKGLEKIKRVKALSGTKIYVVGDNQVVSRDSRHFGWLPLSYVKARLVFPKRGSWPTDIG